MAAATAWAKGGRVSNDEQEAQLKRDAEAYGIPYEQLRQAAGGDETIDEFAVYPDNTEPLEVFLVCGGQWRFRQDGRLMGMDYAALHATMAMLDIGNKAQTFADVRVMEQALIKEQNRVR